MEPLTRDQEKQFTTTKERVTIEYFRGLLLKCKTTLTI